MILQAVLSLRSNAERKVRTTKSNALPNGKDPVIPDTDSATENNRFGFA